MTMMKTAEIAGKAIVSDAVTQLIGVAGGLAVGAVIMAVSGIYTTLRHRDAEHDVMITMDYDPVEEEIWDV